MKQWRGGSRMEYDDVKPEQTVFLVLASKDVHDREREERVSIPSPSKTRRLV